MTAKTVLIVDDEAPIREMIAVALEMADYRVLEADNAQDAHAMVVDHQPDLLLLDWMMPGTSGIELARRLKREEATAELPIIMLTAKGEEDNKIQGLEAGADDYITKPFSPRELVARLKAVLRRATRAVWKTPSKSMDCCWTCEPSRQRPWQSAGDGPYRVPLTAILYDSPRARLYP